MACIDPDGNISTVARAVLAALGQGHDLPRAAREAGVPLYRVRASVRELVAADLLVEAGDGFALTDAARALIA